MVGVPCPLDAGVSRLGEVLLALRLLRRGDLGKLLVMLALVALMKLELATLRIGVGNALSIRCEVGTAPVGVDPL